MYYIELAFRIGEFVACGAHFGIVRGILISPVGVRYSVEYRCSGIMQSDFFPEVVLVIADPPEEIKRQLTVKH